MDPQQEPQDPTRPVAYDANGQPLYAAPQTQQPTASSRKKFSNPSHITVMPDSVEGHNYDPRMRVQYGNEPQVVHVPRAYEPEVGDISDELKQKHDDSVRRFPNLNLSAGEYVIMSVKRHPIGLTIPLIITALLIATLIVCLMVYPYIALDPITGEVKNIQLITAVIMALIVLVGLGGYIAVWVYLRNTFYLTNESVIQEIQQSLFAKHEQTVSLGSIEDASFRQAGIVQMLFNYGTIRLSTEGEETTYRFQYVENPKQQIATLNNAIEAFKNGRPVGD